MDQTGSQEIVSELQPDNVFRAPSIHSEALLAGASYTYHSAIPEAVAADLSTECVMGIDEAGRGPVLGMTTLFSASHSF